jgi:hypothetical protein
LGWRSLRVLLSDTSAEWDGMRGRESLGCDAVTGAGAALRRVMRPNVRALALS